MSPRRGDDDEDRERPSWRELDARRDRSRHVLPDAPQKPKTFEAKRDENKAKKALAGLFAGKKSKVQDGAWKKVTEARGGAFSREASAYVTTHGLPQNWDDLLRLLDHDNPGFVEQVLGRLMELAEHETAPRRDLLVGKLRILKMTAEEPALIGHVERALSLLQAKV